MEETEERVSAPGKDPPPVPSEADHVELRRAVVRALWDLERCDFAVSIAAPDETWVKEKADPLVPQGWRLLLFRSTSAPNLGLYVMEGPANSVTVLSGDVEGKGYASFVKEAGLRIDSPDAALDAAEFYLDKTRNLSRHTIVLRTASDAVLSGGDDGPTARKRLAAKVRAPTVRASDSGYEVRLYVQRGSDVDRWTATVGPDGAVDGTFTTVIKNLPVDFR